MEIIRNYLDSMFANYPNTASVLKAKEELWQMMEDKYTELVEEGKSENEAVGTVISEFGNLSELAEELGLEEEVSLVEEQQTEEEAEDRLVLTAEETRNYVSDMKAGSLLLGLGIACCILCSVGPVLADGVAFINETAGVLALFAILAAGVVMIVFGARQMGAWKYTQAKRVAISMEATKYLQEQQQAFDHTHRMQMTFGILCCALCWVPAAVFGSIPLLRSVDNIAAILVLVFVAVGVFLMVTAGIIRKSMLILLKKNGADTVAANMEVESPDEKEYIHPIIGNILSVYWPTVTCGYLIWSFVSYAWNMSWIVWPIAIAGYVIMDRCLRKRA